MKEINKYQMIQAYRKLFLYAFILGLTLGNIQGQVQHEDIVPGKIRIKLTEESIKNLGNSYGARSSGRASNALGIEAIDMVSEGSNIRSIRRVFPYSVKYEAKHRKYGLHLWYELDFDPETDPLEVVERFKVLGDIELAKPIYKKTSVDANAKVEALTNISRFTSAFKQNSDSLIFDDPLLADQWHYHNEGQFGEMSYDVSLPIAMQLETGSREIIVSVVDGGVDVYHEDLEANIWRNETEINGVEGVDDDQNGYVDDFFGYNFRDDDGAIGATEHGTHVAGTVGAVNNNGIGVVGVAGGDGSGNGVRLMSCQVFDNSLSDGVGFAEAIVYGADNGAVISQNSWGYNTPYYYEPEVLAAIQYFIAEAGQYEGSPMKGGVLFFAAGNTGSTFIKYPGAFDEVISVAAIGPTGFPAGYSTYGEWVDIAAPGGDQLNFGDEGGVLSTLPGDRYGFLAGTSMACPHVSGVAALVLSKFGGSDFTAEDLRRIILGSVDRFNFQHDNLYGRGYLNAAKALLDDNRIPPNAITDLTAREVFHNEVRLSWTVPNDEDGIDPNNFLLAIGSSEITDKNFDNQFLYQIENSIATGEEFEIVLSGFLKQEDYWFAVKSADQFENVSDISNILKVTTTDEPRFMESIRTIDLAIDVNDNPVQSVPMTFSNVGEGIVYWGGYVNNEKYFYTPTDQATTADASLNLVFDENANVVTNNTSTVSNVSQPSILSLESAQTSTFNAEANRDHWKNDITGYVAGISYDDGSNPAILGGTGNPNAGLIMATRFHIPYDYSFNLTHLEVVLLPRINDKPILVEIKKGSRDNLYEAETVYLEKYYPDTVDVLKYYRIPIYNPERFENNETLWVVLHFPKEMEYPLVMQWAPYDLYDNFLVSRDNGRSFVFTDELTGNSFVMPMLNALSTGDDGSYVFLDPTQGEIHQGSSQEINAIVDVSSLTNGHHLASLGIYTNDINKPIVNVEVKVEVIGQEPDIDLTKLHEFDVFNGLTNELELKIANTGLGDLEVYSLAGDSPEVTPVTFTEAITISSSEVGLIPFDFTPSGVGVSGVNLLLQTNIGELVFMTRIYSQEEPEITLGLNQDPVTVEYGGEVSVELTVQNSNAGSDLEYDLSHYNLVQTSYGLLAQKMSMEILTSDDPGASSIGSWEDISGFGTQLITESALVEVEMDTRFPYFNELINNITVTRKGTLSIHEYGSMVPLKVEGYIMENQEAYFHDFGDHAVFSFNSNLINWELDRGWYTEIEGIKIQIAVFRDGSIEYRYQNIDGLTDAYDYSVWIVDIERYHTYYKEVDDANKTLSNGLVIKFQPLDVVPMISNAKPAKGLVPSGSEAKVLLTIDPAAFGYVAGNYDNFVMMKSNTSKGIDSLHFVVQVTGSAEISTNNEVRFDSTFIGQTKMGYVEISNSGADKVQLTSAVIDLPEFTVQGGLPIINGKSNIQLPIQFEPTTTDQLEATLVLSFDDGTQANVKLIANGTFDAFYAHDLTFPLIFDMEAGQLEKIPFSLTNSGDNKTLKYTFVNSTYGYVGSNDLSRAIGESDDEVTPSYGYDWEVSDETNDFYRWKDIKGNGNIVQLEQQEFHPVKLPFDFPFFGEYYDTLWTSVNGFVTVIEPEVDPTSSGSTFIEEDGVRGMIAPFWAEMKPRAEDGGILILTEESKVTFQWDYFGSAYDNNPGYISFQLEIWKDGSIFFHYKDISDWSAMMNYGLESPDESEVLEHTYTLIVSYAHFTNQSSIAISPPYHRTLEIGESQNLNLYASAANIYKAGTYMDTLTLYTNSAAQTLLNIPIQLNVTDGDPVMVATKEVTWEEQILVDGLKFTDQIYLTNNGTAPMIVESISQDGLEDLTLYNARGIKILRTSSGQLSSPIELQPWQTDSITIEISASVLGDIDGKILLNGNFDETEISIKGKVVESPIFDWNAVDQEFSINNTDTAVYSFIVSNLGSSNLKYEVLPAVLPPTDEVSEPKTIETIGELSTEKTITVESLRMDEREKADGMFTTLIDAGELGFANKYTAPEGGFYLTHVQFVASVYTVGEYMQLKVYFGGDLPDEGLLMYEQRYVITEKLNQEWVYFALDEPFVIPEGQDFYITVGFAAPPLGANQYIGYEFTEDISLMERSFSGPGNADKFYWSDQVGWNFIWKLRALTSAGSDSWISLDVQESSLSGNTSENVTLRVDPSQLTSGIHEGKVLMYSNDLNRPSDEFRVQLNVNGAPRFKFYPNIYEDTVKVTETEEIVLNYLFEDPEGEVVNLSMESNEGGPEVAFKQLDNSMAQMTIKTTYEDAGYYNYQVKMSDIAGNEVLDTLMIEVINKNRRPVLNDKYAIIQMNLADSEHALAIEYKDLFIDPDGDEVIVYGGNLTPELIDMSFGYNYVNLNPLAEGTAELIFAADDGHEVDLEVYSVFVQVIDDPDLISTSMNALQVEAILEDIGEDFTLFPNPVVDRNATFLYQLAEPMEVSYKIFDSSGHMYNQEELGIEDEGGHYKNINFTNAKPGLYYCLVSIGGKVKKSIKIIVN